MGCKIHEGIYQVINHATVTVEGSFLKSDSRHEMIHTCEKLWNSVMSRISHFYVVERTKIVKNMKSYILY